MQIAGGAKVIEGTTEVGFGFFTFFFTILHFYICYRSEVMASHVGPFYSLKPGAADIFWKVNEASIKEYVMWRDT